MVKTDKEERKKWDRTYREKNREACRESDKKWRESKKGKEVKKKWRDDNPEKILERDRNYRKNNPEKVNARIRRFYYTIKGRLKMLKGHDSKRLGIKKHKLTTEILEMIDERDKKCVYCGKEFENDIEHDHINPFRQFDNVNIVLACRNCNRDKSRADMVQWMNFKGYDISKKLLDLYKKANS